MKSTLPEEFVCYREKKVIEEAITLQLSMLNFCTCVGALPMLRVFFHRPRAMSMSLDFEHSFVARGV